MVRYVNDYTAILTGSSWWDEGTPRKPTFITYSFETKPFEYLAEFGYTSAYIRSFRPFTTAEKGAALNALKQWDEASGIVFLAVPAGQGDIRFGNYNFDHDSDSADAAAYAYYPDVVIGSDYSRSSAYGGDVFVNTSSMSYPADDMTHLFAHEIGHAIGLKHSHEGDVRLLAAIDDTDHTVMSYNGYEPRLGPLDKLAVKALYGADASDGRQVASWHWNAKTATLTQKGGAGADTIRGVASDDVISGLGSKDILIGSGGDDRIDGGASNDSLFGGDGDDTLIGGAGNDAIHGGDGYYGLDNGSDTAEYGTGSKGVTVDLDGLSLYAGGKYYYYNAIGAETGRDTFSSIENVGGSRAADSLSGDSAANVIHGNSGSDVIDGRAGADWIHGDLGLDKLTGGAGADRFVFDARLGPSNVKTVNDFTARSDKLVFDQDLFAGLTKTGALAEARFYAGKTAHDSNDRIIYDAETGKLSYDADGIGGKGQLLAAKLDTDLVLHGSDFLIIA